MRLHLSLWRSEISYISIAHLTVFYRDGFGFGPQASAALGSAPRFIISRKAGNEVGRHDDKNPKFTRFIPYTSRIAA